MAGLQEQLGLTDRQYQTGMPHLTALGPFLSNKRLSVVAITVTYVPYIATELPSNLILNKVGPRIMIPGMCFCWGVVTTLQCLVRNYAGLLVCRFWLGFFEGGLLPGIVLYLSGYYRKHELQLRICLFFSAAALSGAFSGLLAAAITQMDGIAGLEGWRWIFLLEGRSAYKIKTSQLMIYHRSLHSRIWLFCLLPAAQQAVSGDHLQAGARQTLRRSFTSRLPRAEAGINCFQSSRFPIRIYISSHMNHYPLSILWRMCSLRAGVFHTQYRRFACDIVCVQAISS